MKRMKLIFKRIIIYIVVFMMLLSNTCYGGYTQEQVGDAVAGFAANVVSEYGDQVKYEQLGSFQNDGHTRDDNPIWNSSSYTWNDTSTYYFDCSSFSSGCIHAVTGLLSSALNTTELIGLSSDPNFEVIDYSSSALKTGDVVVHDDGQAHAVVYVGQEYSAWDTSGAIANNGSTFRSVSYFDNNYDFKIVRVSESGAKNLTSLDTTFSKTGSSSATAASIDYSNFFFNGIPDGKYSLASRKNIFEILVESLKELLNFFTGLITYLFRGLIIGIISIFDRLINNTVQSINDAPKSLEESGVSATSADDPYSMNRSVTIEGLVFNDIDLFDINIFRID